jgi:Arm DNA-binding domain
VANFTGGGGAVAVWRRRNKRQLLALGHWPQVTLADARDRAHEARVVLEQGIDPRKAGIVRRIRTQVDSLDRNLREPDTPRASSKYKVNALAPIDIDTPRP